MNTPSSATAESIDAGPDTGTDTGTGTRTDGDAGGDLLEMAGRLLGAHVRPLSGGYSGETFLVGTDDEAAVLRMYQRQPERAAIDAALLRLVRDLVPVPRVLDVRESDGSGPAHVLQERLPGRQLDQVLADPSTPTEVRRAAGHSVGGMLGRLAGIPFPAHGEFTGPDLGVRPMPGPGADLPAMLEAHRGSGALADWPDERIAALTEVLDEAQSWLDLPSRVCLAHADVNGKNMLVDPRTGELTGVLDWEFAFAGTPYVDVANLLRFETDEVFARAAVEAYRAAAYAIGDDFLERARAVDLFALIDLAARPHQHTVTRQAAELLAATAATETLAAGRPDWR